MPFIAGLIGVAFSAVMAITPIINIPGGSEENPVYPAPPGYLLPWEGGQIHAVTQGEETGFTHNGSAAYAFDFDLSYTTVVAARSGKVAMVREDSNQGGCSSFYSASSNYVLIDHGDGTAGLYLHLAYDSAQVAVGQEVRQGEPIAISGETGVTCSGETGLDPGAHLHFQVQPFVEGKYFTQSQPIAFDDIPTNNGVPRDGQSYVSGNYGPGKPQKIGLTPYRVSRVFNPQAVPLNPELVQAENPTETPPAGPAALWPSHTPTPTRTPLPLAELTITPEVPTEEPILEPSPEPEPSIEPPTAVPPPPTATHTPLPQITPVPSNTPLPPTATLTPELMLDEPTP